MDFVSLVGKRRIILTRRQEMIDAVLNAKYPMMRLMANETRYEIVNALRHRNKTYTEIRIDIGMIDKSFAFHIKLLTELHVVSKNKMNSLYNLSVKGLRCLKGVDLINEAEMFI